MNHWTERLSLPNWDDFVNKVIPSKQNMEGYVLRLKSGQRIKIKTSWYRALHKTSSKLDNPNHLFEAVLEETVDDMKAMLHDNAGAISAIIEMEEFVDNIYVSLVTAAEDFFERYNHLGRKEYVMLGKEELDKRALQLAVQKYLGREVDYKSFIKSHWKDFGWKKS
uniref:T4 RNA ligase 1 C-terminal domain-containing protein n=1 Tax=Helicotheca tamesis TaxID=374047 RepID=A0A7S2MLK3_9STRA